MSKFLIPFVILAPSAFADVTISCQHIDNNRILNITDEQAIELLKDKSEPFFKAHFSDDELVELVFEGDLGGNECSQVPTDVGYATLKFFRSDKEINLTGHFVCGTFGDSILYRAENFKALTASLQTNPKVTYAKGRIADLGFFSEENEEQGTPLICEVKQD